MLVSILHDLVDQPGDATGRVNTVLTSANCTTELVRAVMAKEPHGEFAPHASNGDGAYFAGLAL
eukprot:1906530-Amphidinium_carterae.1